MFNRPLQQRSSNNNYSLHMQRVFTQDWLNSFWIAVVCSVLLFISLGKAFWWRRISLPLRNLYKCKQFFHCYCLWVFFLLLSLQSCCCLFTFTCLAPFIILHCWCCLFTCLLVYPLFYIDVVAIFLFIHWSCK